MHGKLARANIWVAGIKVDDFRGRSAVCRHATRYDWPGVIAFVNIEVVVAQAGRVSATNYDTGLEAGPISRCAG